MVAVARLTPRPSKVAFRVQIRFRRDERGGGGVDNSVGSGGRKRETSTMTEKGRMMEREMKVPRVSFGF